MQEHLVKYHPEEMIVQDNQMQRKPVYSRSKKPYCVIDGNNVAYYLGNPSIKAIKQARVVLRKEFEPIIIVSAALRHKIDDVMELTRLINLGWIIEAESKTDDDVTVIEEAYRKKCIIVSNDNYKEYIEEYTSPDWSLSKNIRNYRFIDNKFKLEN